MAKERPGKKLLRIGHRGACGHAPENTLASIEQAIALGCDFAEVDVQRTADGSLVLLHDSDVDRTTDGKGLVAEINLEDLQQLDAGGGQKVPTLEEALQTTSGRIGLVLELKGEGLAYDLVSTVRASGFSGPVIYASFQPDDLQHIRRIEPDGRTMILFDRLPKLPVAEALNFQATHVGLRFTKATAPLVQALHKAGLTAFVYTVNKPADIKRMHALDVDGIVSDWPERI
jgi:glycerophosphoryl diester phosphodiesterase